MAVPEGQKKSGRGSHWTLLVVFLSLLIDLLGFTVILPLIPSMLEYYSKDDKGELYSYLIDKVDVFRSFIGAPEEERFNLVLLGGLLGSMFSLLQFLVSPIIGASSDIYGRKAVLLISMVGVAVSYGVWAVSRSFTLFVLARVIGGISKGNVSISTAVVTDITTPEKRSKGMALVGIAFSLGFLFGPMIGALFSVMGKSYGEAGSFTMFQYPALFALTLAVLDIGFVAAFFTETLPPKNRASSLGHGLVGALYLVNPISLFRFDALPRMTDKDRSNLRWLGLTYFLYLFLFSGLEYSLTFLCHQRFNYTRGGHEYTALVVFMLSVHGMKTTSAVFIFVLSMDQGKMFLFIGVIMILVQGGYVRRRPPGSEKRTALMGMLLIIPGMLLVGWASSTKMMFLGLVFYSFGAGTIVPSMTTIASKFGDGDEKGKVMGIFRSLGALSRALGPFIACTVYWQYSACVCYMIGAVLFLLPALLLTLVNPKVSPKKDS